MEMISFQDLILFATFLITLLVSNASNAFSSISSKTRSVGNSFSGISFNMPRVSERRVSKIKGYAAEGFQSRIA